MSREDFCKGWKFAKGDWEGAARADFDDGAWEPVVLPHTWNAQDMAPDAAGEPYVGPAWYRKRFTADRPSNGARLFLRFEAVANMSRVWVDGAYVGGRDGGFLSFRLDITEALGDGPGHVVAVRADNSPRSDLVPPETIDWERYGGVYRPAWLERKGWAHFAHKSLRVLTPAVSARRGRVVVRCRVCRTRRTGGELMVRHRVADPTGAEVSAAETRLGGGSYPFEDSEVELPAVRSPRLWSPDSPSVYRVESTLWENGGELDRETNPLGFRWFRFDKDKGFFLNGKRRKLRGADLHQDYPGLGWAAPARFHRMDMEQMRAAGLNFLRASHYPRNERVLEACDELGILVMEEQPFWHGSLRSAHGEAFIVEARRLMREMAEHHANHPCIIVWNLVNEIMLCPRPRLRHPEPGEPRALLPKEEWPYARRAIGEMNDAVKQADPTRPTCLVVGAHWQLNDEAGTTQIADLVGYNGGAINTLTRDRLVIDIEREKFPQRIAIMTEGVANDRPPMRADWEKELKHWEIHARHWDNFYARDWFCGGAMWVFADYSANGRYRNMGLVDYSRLPYEAWHFYRSQWTEALMAHICGHWDWPGEEGRKRRVTVFTNGAEAELFLNGRPLGGRRPNRRAWPRLPHPPIEWEVQYEPGELKIVARKNGAEAVDVRMTSGEPAAAALQADPARIFAGGWDVAFVTAVVVDAAGRRCYRADRELEIAVSGTCRLVGPSRVLARGGVARFAIRSTGPEGEALVCVKDQSLSDGITTVVTSPER